MKAFLLLFALILFFCNYTNAQYYTNQNKVWAFGSHAGLDFTSGSPAAIATSIIADEGCASVSDTNGHLLFYTDGKKVFNKTGSLMPSGSSIVSFTVNSTEQAALIIPFISDPNKYYLFSLESFGASGLACRLAYSIVDMTLDGGLGDVDPTSTGISLGDFFGENMIAIPGDNNTIWLITHGKDTALFFAYAITSIGIDTTPVISAVGGFNGVGCYGHSMLKASPNRRKIAQAVLQVTECYGNELFDFDPNTGEISNCILLDTIGFDYGVEFSPDNTKLYFGSSSSGSIIQYDISLLTSSAIIASVIEVTNTARIGSDLKLGPDGKIYFASLDSYHLDCISNPNNGGSLCGYISNAVVLATGTEVEEGLPNLFVTTDTVNRVLVNEVDKQAGIILFPNPVVKKLTVVSTNKIESVSICNVLGQAIFNGYFNSMNAEVNLEDLPEGVYFVKVNGAEVKKFAKQ